MHLYTILAYVNSNSTVTQSDEEQGDHIMTTTLSVPRELWKRVKIAAAQHDTTAQQICWDGLELRLAQLAKKAPK